MEIIEWEGTQPGFQNVGSPDKRPNDSTRKIIRTIREKSIFGQGPKLFNALPKCIREWSGEFEGFKILVDCFLELIPDEPIISGYRTKNTDLYSKETNYLTHWIRNLNLQNWTYKIDTNVINI